MIQEYLGEKRRHPVGIFLERAGKWMWRNLDLLSTICVGIVVFILDVLGVVNKELTTSVTLAVLVAVSFGLMKNREATTKLARAVSDLGVGKTNLVMQRYDCLWPKVYEEFTEAEEVWTIGICPAQSTANFKPVLRKGGKFRVISLNPRSRGMQIAERHFKTPFRSEGTLTRETTATLRNLAHLKVAFGEQHLQYKVVNHIPVYSMIVFDPDPQSKRGRVYIHLQNFQEEIESTPSFYLTWEQNPSWFTFFCDQFEKLWQEAEQWEESVTE